jgi:multicomponent Na+:H+ antiporter subunit A
MLLFMGSMVGLAVAQDLILVFVFRDLMAIASYCLIGFDCHEEDLRASALMALLVTRVTAVFLQLGALILYAAYGTFSIPDVVPRWEPTR